MIGAGKRFKSRNEMSQFLGLTETTRTTLFNFLDGTQTKYTIVFEWIEKLSLLDGGEDFLVPIIRRMGIHSPAQKVEGSNLPTIPIVGFVGAGAGYENAFNVEPLHSIAVLQEYILPGLFACKVKGKSMDPTIKDGSYVGVVPLAGPLVDGDIYLVWEPHFGERVKRVFRGEPDTNTIILKSDNKIYADETIAIEGYEKVIIGKVAWVWQEV